MAMALPGFASAARLFMVFALGRLAAPAAAHGRTGLRQRSLLQAGARNTPITRVVNLLKEMQSTIQKEMAEDQALHDKLTCWCNNNDYEKTDAAEKSEQKIAELTASIENLASRSSELKMQIKNTEAEVSSNKEDLAEATALRKKQLDEFHGSDLDNVQAIENLKAALEVLSKHHTSTPAPWGQGEDSYGKPSDRWSLLSLGQRSEPWTEAHEASHIAHALDELMRRNGITGSGAQRFLQSGTRGDGAPIAASAGAADLGLSADESSVVRLALRSAATFVQARHGGGDGYFPSYHSRSGEIVGVLKQLKEEMEGDHAEAQKLEQQRAASFEELRAAKTAEIDSGEKMAERKEDELATTDNDLAEAKEDLEQEKASLSETERFLSNLKETCSEADKNFEARKKARMEESTAVSETIAILSEDDARSTFSETYSFFQVESGASSQERSRRSQAAVALRRAAAAFRDPQLSMLATSVELDAFVKVKKAIDGMLSMLKTQQDDEVKKNDWCNKEFHDTEMTAAKTESRKEDLQAKETKLESDILELEKGAADAKSQIAELQLNLQRANENRRTENMDFQKSVSDQTITVEVLTKALSRLAQYYKEQDSLVQVNVLQRQTPPVPQAEYSKNKGAAGVMQMIEKIIVEAKSMTADARKAENEAQAAYEKIVADTNDSVAALQKEVVTKTKAKTKASSMKLQTGSDIVDTVKELEGLSKYTETLHGECDYVQKNFGLRQEARANEIESLQQAKQILSGATFS